MQDQDGQNINNFKLYSSFNVRDHVSQPYSRTGNIIVLYILIFKLLERSLEDKNYGRINLNSHSHS